MPLSQNLALKFRLRVIRSDEIAFGPGKAQLLESLLETQSLNGSAKAMKMSYVKALSLVRAMNTHFRKPLVKLSRGGRMGGGTQVTDAGREALAEYQAMREASEKAAQTRWKRLRKLVKE